MITNKQLAKKFATKYSLPKRYFGLPKSAVRGNEWRFRRLITNVLVGGSSEDNTLAAAEEIFSLYPTMLSLAEADHIIVSNILKDNGIRFAGRKAINIFSISWRIHYDLDGIVPSERKHLESMPGIGRHTASIIRALAFDEPEFGVDLHVNRIADRIGLISNEKNDLATEETLKKGIPLNAVAAFSRAFVDFGKETCAAQPDCANCFLSEECNYAKGIIKVTKKLNKAAAKPVAALADSKFTVQKSGKYECVAGSSERPYTVTVSTVGICSCNCKGFRFKRTCSHVKQIHNEIHGE